ncbi:hypothetical protein ACOTHJ_15880 [Achromobacter xylosoxidans]|uniref:hypothetical protein n=1 Tax=Achromobacter anxifer TaxID=1287737 RepID=UPI00155CB29D|nr:hypothetical protein [Achromobacter anxifer]CAB5514475.1 hypothetical protein LMG26857_03534 [Achromobacter anxifer]
MATISNLKPGQSLFKLERRRMGNTTLRTTAVMRVLIHEVHEDHVIASVNSNTPRKYRSSEVSKWKVNKPVMIQFAMGFQRPATRAEIAEMKSKATTA